MVLNPKSEVREVQGVASDQMMLIRAFIQGAVYSWVKNRKGEWFAVRDLAGGENFDWNGTPLQTLFDKHVKGGKPPTDAIEAAGRDIGWITKSVLSEDKRTFEADNSGYVSQYRWAGNEP